MVRVPEVTISLTEVEMLEPLESPGREVSTGRASERVAPTPVERGTEGVKGAVKVTPVSVEASEMMDEEIAGASEIGQTVSVRMTVLVTTKVDLSDSGRVAMSVGSAGQLVTVGAQLVMVLVWVAMTVSVVMPAASVAVELSRRKWKWRGCW
jgi:hypothetical protein